MRVAVTVNGAARTADVPARQLLVSFLREDLGLTGTKVGCDTSSCGACTVLLNGESVKSCTLFAVQADGEEVTTIEGVSPEGGLNPLQAAFREYHALQCGYCTPGMVMALMSLLREEPGATKEQIRRGLDGNLCRCTGYTAIVRAARSVASGGGTP
ncbi:MAG TPA: (2Fe-2S)-binding protein [Streptosporangiaceae bacterium]|jgi:aerobic-type carbon monoxide dehydrogenase small subunit (CoxS/CutS family)|nr:(2Fe-2S)-binding protein [Streptosporangiaceae bacterium]